MHTEDETASYDVTLNPEDVGWVQSPFPPDSLEFAGELADRGVTWTAEGKRLVYRGPSHAIRWLRAARLATATRHRHALYRMALMLERGPGLPPS
jgi:hypothetical protein